MKICINKIEKSVNNTNISIKEELEIPSEDIYISDIKDLLSEKYGIPFKQIKLSIMQNKDNSIILQNENQLKDYKNIYTNNCKIEINLERIIFNISNHFKSTNSLVKKITAKEKYLLSLGIYSNDNNVINNNNTQNLPAQVNTQSKKNRHNSFSHYGNENLTEKIIKAIKGKNLDKFKEIIIQYLKPNFDKINEPLNMENNWNALHYSCYYGCVEITNYLLKDIKADVNIQTKDNYTPLFICIYKENFDIIRLLVSVKSLNINFSNQTYGSALHLAAKKNSIKTINLLVSAGANVFLKDSNDEQPIDLATRGNVKKLLAKVMTGKRKKSIESEGSCGSNNSIKDLKAPPRVIGYIEKIGNKLPIYRGRILEVDPVMGYIRRYKTYNDFPFKPNETIPIIEISSCVSEYEDINTLNEETIILSNEKESEDNIINNNMISTIKSDSDKKEGTYHYFSLTYKTKEMYRIQSKTASKKWIEIINESILYCKQTQQHNKNEINNLQTLIINCKTGELSDMPSNKVSITNMNNKNSKEEEQNDNISNNNNFYNYSTIIKKEILIKMGLNPYEILTDPKEKGLTFDSFEIISLIGNGSFGKIYKVKLKNSTDNTIYAMKVLNKNNLVFNDQLKYAITECNILKLSNNPFIVKLYYSFQTKDNLYMILEYCPGGDIGYHLTYNLFEEKEAKFYIAELILAIEHLHNMDIIYRDLKPENILINHDNHIKLADFGLAKEKINNISLAHSFCGSPMYLSPEMVLRKGVGKQADIYGIGACLYEMVCGSTPFFDKDFKTLMKNIVANELILHNYFSDNLQDLLKKLLCKDPNKRISISEIKKHSFFKGINWNKLINKKIKPPIDLVELKMQNDIISGNVVDTKTNFYDKDYNKSNCCENRVSNFTFIRNNENNDI